MIFAAIGVFKNIHDPIYSWSSRPF